MNVCPHKNVWALFVGILWKYNMLNDNIIFVTNGLYGGVSFEYI